MPNTLVVLTAVFAAALVAPSGPTLDDVKAELPDGWTRRKVLDDTALVLLAPGEEAGWQANVAIDLARDKGRRSLEQMVKDLLPNRAKFKKKFELKSQTFITHRSGRKACVVEYKHELDGIPLRSRELIMPLQGDVVMFAEATGADSLWDKYEPHFSRILDSIDVAPGRK
jgi:hypothetical protein